MRVGVLGCGYWGSKHVRVLHSIEEVERVVLIDRFEPRAIELQQAFPATGRFVELEDAVAAGAVDAVIVATPPGTHAEVALQAIDAGLHVMVEKPLAANARDAARVVHAAEQRGVILMSGHTFEYNAAVWRLRDAVRSGELGDIHYIDAARLNLGLYQPDVNVIWDLAPHDISVANFVLSERPVAVSAWASSYAGGRFEDVATLRLDYPSGVMATIRVSWLDPCKVRRTTVVGSQKMAVYNDINDGERIKLYDRGVARHDELVHEQPTSYRYGDVVVPFVDFKEPLLVEDRHFVQSVLAGTMPNTTGRDGLDVVRVLEASDLALREQRTVLVDEIELALSPV